MTVGTPISRDELAARLSKAIAWYEGVQLAHEQEAERANEEASRLKRQLHDLVQTGKRP